MRRRFLKIGSVGAIAVSFGLGHARSDDSEPYGRFTRDQILKIATPVCRRICQSSKPLLLLASPSIAWARNGAPMFVWIVDRSEPGAASPVRGFGDIHTVWDAVTGRLLSASFGPGYNAVRASVMSQPEAEQTASRWIRELDLDGPQRKWNRVDSARLVQQTWNIYRRSGDGYRMRISLDARTADLISAQVWRAPFAKLPSSSRLSATRSG